MLNNLSKYDTRLNSTKDRVIMSLWSTSEAGISYYYNIIPALRSDCADTQAELVLHCPHICDEPSSCDSVQDMSRSIDMSCPGR